MQEHPDLFEGVTEAIGEVGGFSVSVGDQRMYAVQTAEKGLAWMRLTANGTAGHGSMIHKDNAITALAKAVARVGQHQWPTQLPDATTEFLTRASEALKMNFDPQDPAKIINRLGGMSKMIGATTQHTANPTGLQAGYKVNVIPQTATADLDGRFLPGREQEFFEQLDELLGAAVTREFIHHDIALETTADGHLWESMAAALSAEDPDATWSPTASRPGPTRSTSAPSASAASGSARSSCRRSSTSRACSTASTSASRWTAWRSASGCSTGCSAPRKPQNVLTARMMRRRRVAFLLPSANSRSLASSQAPYSAWSVRIRRAASRVVPRGRFNTR